MSRKIKIITHNETPHIFYVYFNENKFATLDTHTSESFENSIRILEKSRAFKGENWIKTLTTHFIHSDEPEVYELISFAYLWTLKSGLIKEVQAYEKFILPKVASKISIDKNRRWLFSFDNTIDPNDRFKILIDWINDIHFITQKDRIDKWLSIHGLFLLYKRLTPTNQQLIFILYSDFISEISNLEIERIFGETIEADFITLKRQRQSQIKKEYIKKNKDEIITLLDNWLMRRYAIEEVFSLPILVLIFFTTSFLYSFLIPLDFSINNNTDPQIFLNLSKFSFPIVIILFFITWQNGGWRLSKIIWGNAIGWFFVLSATLTDLIYQDLGTSSKSSKLPQLLRLEGFEVPVAILLFAGAAVLIIQREIKGAEIKPKIKSIKRMVFVITFALFIGLMEGIIFINLLSWYFFDVAHWYNKWVVMLLSLGTVQAISIGVITQLIWENRRLTEVLRK